MRRSQLINISFPNNFESQSRILLHSNSCTYKNYYYISHNSQSITSFQLKLTDIKSYQEIVYLFANIYQVFLYCYWGNEVTTSSLNVSQASYEVNFVGKDVNFQRGIAMIMLRSQKTLEITMGKFIKLSLSTFASVIQSVCLQPKFSVSVD